MVGTMKIRIDENEADKFTKVKKFGVTTTETTKRAALGDLQNRAVLRVASSKEAAPKDLNDIKLKNVLQNTKARVDTHWKKAPAVVNGVAKNNGAHAKTDATAAIDQPRKVMLTRSNSLRVGTNNVVGIGNALQRHASNSLVAAHNKPKTLTTKIVENKLQQGKLGNKAKALLEEKVKKTGEQLALRREDSNLSRKSLTKLKAALSRDGSKASVSKASSAPTLVAKTVETKSEAVKQEVISSGNDKTKAAESLKTDLKIVSVQTYSSEVLSAVEDIDAGDSDKLLLVAEYVNDIYNYLFQLEAEQFIRENHLNAQEEVYPKMRAVLIDWINEVHFQFHLAPETFQMAVAIIDRYLQAVTDTKRSLLQLVGVTALFIAAKYEELYPPAISDFVYITDDTYSSKQIIQMELKIFKTLDCNLARPLPIHFLRRFSKAAKAEDIHHAMAKYFLELTSIEYDLASYKPSEIAAASLFLTLHLLIDNAREPSGFNNKHWTPTLEWYSRYNVEQLRPITKKIAAVVRNAANAKLKAVYTKYQSSKFHKVSMRSELYGALIDSIINSKE